MKLKIPKDETYENEEEEDTKNEKKIQNKERVCDVCNKVFGSGKALGGHMRVHFRAYKDQICKENKKKAIKLKKFKSSSSNASSLDQIGSNEPVCSLCGKIFPSMKSLFGHMRCHPEREWRGIHPPPSPSPVLPAKKSSAFSSSTNSEAELIDAALDGDERLSEPVYTMEEVLPKWSVTGKRGRKALNMANDDEDDVEEEFRAAVHDLMFLARSGGGSCDHSSSHLAPNNKNGETFHLTSSSNELIVGDDHHHLMNELVNIEGKGSTDGANSSDHVSTKVVGECMNVVVSDDELGCNESSLIGKEDLIIKNKEKKRMKLRDLVQIQDNSPPLIIHDTPAPHVMEALQDEVFGQTTGRVLDFDLNELPHMDEAHHHYTGGCHFASSSSTIDHDLLK